MRSAASAPGYPIILAHSMLFSHLLSQVRSENLNVYRASPQRLREDVGQEAQIAQDYHGRLIYELLQNADDAMPAGSAQESRIAFILDDDALWVANSGRELDEADVRGLCGISASSKRAGPGKCRASIGHKGMGFKSVLEITDTPEVYSTSISFHFSAARAVDAMHPLVQEGVLLGVTRAPVTRFPWEIDTEPAQWQELRSQGMRTAFRFPLKLKMTAKQRDGLAHALRQLPVTTLVFLKRISQVAVSVRRRDSACSFVWTTQRQRFDAHELVEVPELTNAGTYHVVLESDKGEKETFFVAHEPTILIGEHRGGLDDFTWEGVEMTEVSVAARMRDVVPIPLDPAWKKFHVFLPTAESCPYDLLVSGAFVSNLSRQEIRVELDPNNYNRHLLRHAAQCFRDQLIPHLLHRGATIVDILKLLDRTEQVRQPCNSAAAQVFVDEVRSALLAYAFLPRESEELTSIGNCVVPPLVADAAVGQRFRELLPPNACFASAQYPASALCGSDIARILIDHGAHELTPDEAVVALAASDPLRARLRAKDSITVDPVLNVLGHLWQLLPDEKREELAGAARREPVFPIGIGPGGEVQRVSTEGLTCFYPPRSLHGVVPLDGLCFLMQEVCWGDLTPKERNQRLKQDLVTWQALFDVQEFKFPAVMRASVLPSLDLERERSSAREHLHSLERIAAICQLAGRTPSPNAPLPFERLKANRALFNLSRLDLPCQGEALDEIVWVPAYKAYFGRDWVGDSSVECVLDAGREIGLDSLPKFHFLVPPQALAGLLSKYRHLEALQDEEADAGIDEVSVDEDDEAALESDERTRWMHFFVWLGVNQPLRPVHFHDVEDHASGWLKTAQLQRPDGWIFHRTNADDWHAYLDQLRDRLNEEGVGREATLYFYELHDLEWLDWLLWAAERDKSTNFARALYMHLASNWSKLERYSQAVVAQIGAGNVPSMRTKPPRAKDDELVDAGENFWLFRLKRAAFCPTGHGPRKTDQVWLPTQEVARRFGRGGGQFLVPVLDVDAGAHRGRPKGFALTLGIREELSPTTFTLNDVRVVLTRLRDLYATRFAIGEELKTDLREVIRPAYRHLFELLPNKQERDQRGMHEAAPLADAPLLGHDGQGRYEFFETRDLYYLDRRDTRDRLQATTTVWSFVLEALPGARAPIAQVFGVPVLEDELTWSPRPSDPALSEPDLAHFKQAVYDLAPFLLARVAADRADERLAKQDAHRLRRFIDALEAVTYLDVGFELAGQAIHLECVSRDAFVQIDGPMPAQAFVVWGDNPWPPDSREAEALANALCDVFDVRYFEPFLALIQAATVNDRERLLRRAGAPLDIDERRFLLGSEDICELTDVNPRPEVHHDPKSIDPTAIGAPNDDRPERSTSLLRVPRTQIYGVGQLLVNGEPVLVTGTGPQGAARRSMSSDTRSDATQPRGGPMPGYGGHTDLDLLNRVGMAVALSFERNRLRRAGFEAAQIFDTESGDPQPGAFVFDVSSPQKIAYARARSERFNAVMERLCRYGISTEWPGFDLLTIHPGEPFVHERLIELKSSGVTARVQEMSWNEWKTATSSSLRENFYLYLVGNLRSDLRDAAPFVRTIRNPFEHLLTEVRSGTVSTRKVQLAVHGFKEAEHLDLAVAAEPAGPSAMPTPDTVTGAS